MTKLTAIHIIEVKNLSSKIYMFMWDINFHLEFRNIFPLAVRIIVKCYIRKNYLLKWSHMFYECMWTLAHVAFTCVYVCVCVSASVPECVRVCDGQSPPLVWAT